MAVGAKDYSAQILKLKSKGIDAVIFFAAGGDCITFVRQVKEARLNLKYLYGYKGTWNTDFWNALGKDANYVLADGFWAEDWPFPKAKELGERYYKQFNKRSVSIGEYYALCQTLFTAIERAGTLNGAKVRDAVMKTHFIDTVMGDINTILMNSNPPAWRVPMVERLLKTVYPFDRQGV
jgi:branched-chain amino acid transport system substrate-binding protein